MHNVIVVLVNGKPISEPWLQKNIPALIEAWEPGNLGGQAVAEIIIWRCESKWKITFNCSKKCWSVKNDIQSQTLCLFS